MEDPVADAADLVSELFPGLRWAVLGGSVVTAARTAGSDLDIVVLLPDGHDEPAAAWSRHWRGWPVELFVYTQAGLESYLRKDLDTRRPVLARLIGGSVTLAGSAEEAALWRARCATLLTDGPEPLTRGELDEVRYGVSDLLDDLTHSEDPGETSVIVAQLWLAVASLACDVAGHWRGSGKWSLRELRRFDRRFAQRWVAASGDAGAVAAMAREVLDRAGGPLFDGHRRSSGSRQPSPAIVFQDEPATERWGTPEEILVARSRLEAAIPGWSYPAVYGVGRLVGDGVEFARVNTELHKLPAVVLATVCGHTAGSASYVLGRDALDRAITLLAPAQADTSQDHPNLAAWRRLRRTLDAADRVVLAFDADPMLPCADPYVLAMREAVRPHTTVDEG